MFVLISFKFVVCSLLFYNMLFSHFSCFISSCIFVKQAVVLLLVEVLSVASCLPGVGIYEYIYIYIYTYVYTYVYIHVCACVWCVCVCVCVYIYIHTHNNIYIITQLHL